MDEEKKMDEQKQPGAQDHSGEAEVNYNVARGESLNFGGTADSGSGDAGDSGSGSYDDQTYSQQDSEYSGYSDGYMAGGGDDTHQTGDYGRNDYNSGYNDDSYSSNGCNDSSYGQDTGQTYSGGYDGYGQQYAGGGFSNVPPKQVKPKKSGGTKKVLAAILVIALCGLAGFGGSTLANRSNGGSSSSSSPTRVNISGDVSSLNAASAIAEKVMPSVVGISTVSEQQRQTIFGTQSGTVQGVGTGIIVSEDGYILTNSHVINDGNTETITVDLYDGKTYSGKVLWNDSSLDLAIVKIDASGLTAAELGDSDKVAIGDYAIAIGNPMGLNYERSVTSGIISGLNRSITTSDESTGSTNNMDGLIQTDAAINSGNSGGPLINSSGQVIGINTAKASSAEGLGFSIPINTATPIIKQIKEKGTYEASYMGIAGVDLSTIMENYQTNFSASSGVYVAQIYTDSPASKAGLKEGDVITAINGKAIDGMSALKSALVNYSPGDEITLTIERNKSNKEVKLTLGSESESSGSLQSKSSTGTDGSAGNSGSSESGSSQGSGSFGGGLGNLFG